MNRPIASQQSQVRRRALQDRSQVHHPDLAPHPAAVPFAQNRRRSRNLA
jgi:hypothetical protein